MKYKINIAYWAWESDIMNDGSENIDLKIRELERDVKELWSQLTKDEMEILKKTLEIHADNIHIKSPGKLQEIIRLIKEKIKNDP